MRKIQRGVGVEFFFVSREEKYGFYRMKLTERSSDDRLSCTRQFKKGQKTGWSCVGHPLKNENRYKNAYNKCMGKYWRISSYLDRTRNSYGGYSISIYREKELFWALWVCDRNFDTL